MKGGPPRFLRAVDGVSFDSARGEILGLAGESGCGKSTLAMTLLGLQRPTAGRIEFLGEDLAAPLAARPGAFRRAAAARLPGSLRVAQPAVHGRPDGGGAAGHPRLGDAAERRQRVLQTTRAPADSAGRSSCPYPASAQRRPAPARRAGPRRRAAARGSWSPTSRSRCSTSRCAPGSCGCSSPSRATSGWRSSTSATTCRRCATSPTASR